jgi:hypothetical protein
VGDGGDALYRSLVVADGAIAVTLDFHSRGVSGTRTVHRGRCGLPPDPEQTAERVRLLLAAADRAAAKAVEPRRGNAGAAAGRAEPSSRRVPDGPRDARREDRGSAAPHELEGRAREHAHPDAAAAA